MGFSWVLSIIFTATYRKIRKEGGKRKKGRRGRKHISEVSGLIPAFRVCVCVFQLWQNEGLEWLHHSALSTCHQNTSRLGVCSSGPRNYLWRNQKGREMRACSRQNLKPKTHLPTCRHGICRNDGIGLSVSVVGMTAVQRSAVEVAGPHVLLTTPKEWNRPSPPHCVTAQKLLAKPYCRLIIRPLHCAGKWLTVWQCHSRYLFTIAVQFFTHSWTILRKGAAILSQIIAFFPHLNLSRVHLHE